MPAAPVIPPLARPVQPPPAPAADSVPAADPATDSAAPSPDAREHPLVKAAQELFKARIIDIRRKP
jgi:hypothetical protein